MQSDDDRNTPRPSNIFLREFLDCLGRRNEPPAAAEAAVAGPWHVEAVHTTFYAVYRSGESFARGHRPFAVFTDPTHALLIAALLPATGRDPLFQLQKEAGPSGYAIETGGEVIGHLAVFDDKLVDALHVVECLLRSPESLANLLEAAGGMVLERAEKYVKEITEAAITKDQAVLPEDSSGGNELAAEPQSGPEEGEPGIDEEGL